MALPSSGFGELQINSVTGAQCVGGAGEGRMRAESRSWGSKHGFIRVTFRIWMLHPAPLCLCVCAHMHVYCGMSVVPEQDTHTWPEPKSQGEVHSHDHLVTALSEQCILP